MGLLQRIFQLEQQAPSSGTFKPVCSYTVRPSDTLEERRLAKRAASLVHEQQHGHIPGGEPAYIEIEEVTTDETA